MSSPSVQVQPQPNTTKGVSSRPSPDSSPDAMSFDIVRCSRCQRSLCLENESSPGVVRFGMNSYYCSRCASMVGFVRWSESSQNKPTTPTLQEMKKTTTSWIRPSSSPSLPTICDRSYETRISQCWHIGSLVFSILPFLATRSNSVSYVWETPDSTVLAQLIQLNRRVADFCPLREGPVPPTPPRLCPMAPDRQWEICRCARATTRRWDERISGTQCAITVDQTEPDRPLLARIRVDTYPLWTTTGVILTHIW